MKRDYFFQDTIVALATGSGGALSVIRISGPEALFLLNQLRRRNDTLLEPRKAILSSFFFPNGEPLDQGVFIFYPAPHSFTGEDVVELFIHGGTYLAERVLETLVKGGASLALPGEFSFRAVRNGKMSVFQAQAVQDLIQATQDQGISLALKKLSGGPDQVIQQLSADVKQLVGLAELGIDFSDQDLEEVSLSSLKKLLKKIRDQLVQLESSYSRGKRLQEGYCLALVGLPNVGKSSFFNRLLGENRSLVSELAGTTRDLVSEQVTFRRNISSAKQSEAFPRLQTLCLRLEDTAGLRSSTDQIEKMGIEKTFEAIERADLVLLLAEATPLSDFHQIAAIEALWKDVQSRASVPLNPKAFGILTKQDLCDHPATIPSGSCLSALQWFRTSSVLGTGFQEVIAAFFDYFEKKEPPVGAQEVLLTRLEQVKAVRESLLLIDQCLKIQEIDIFASDLRSLLYMLNPLIGETLIDDVLIDIFSRFCIGK